MRLRVAVLVLALLATALTVRNSLAAPDRPSAAVASQSHRFTEKGGLVTPTPPPPATLDSPADNALLPQPVAPNQWLFTWHAPRCGSVLYLAGPGGRAFVSPSIGPVGPPPSSFGYVYTQTIPLPADALGPWLWHVEYDCSTYQGTSETRTFWVDGGAIATPTEPITTTATPTESVIATATPTPPPTAFPLEPDDNAILPQPVAPDYWRFRWEGIYCAYKLYLAGPGGRSFVSPSIGPVGPPPFYFQYDYVQDAPLPAEALGPWTWYVKDECAGGQSPIRTFWISGAQITATPTSVTPTTTVTPTLAEQAYLPLVVR
jgi:hypothetical protein